MKITFSEDKSTHPPRHQARAEGDFASGDGHGDFCLTAYGRSREEAHHNLRQLAALMARSLDAVKRP